MTKQDWHPPSVCEFFGGDFGETGELGESGSAGGFGELGEQGETGWGGGEEFGGYSGLETGTASGDGRETGTASAGGGGPGFGAGEEFGGYSGLETGGPGGGGTSDGGNAPFGGGEEFGGYSGLETGGPAAGVGPEGNPAAYGGFGDPTAGAHAEGPGGPSTTGGPAEGPSSLADMATQAPTGPWGPVGGFDEMLSTIVGPAITSPLEGIPGRAEPAGMPGRAMGPSEVGFPMGGPAAGPFGAFGQPSAPGGVSGLGTAYSATDQGGIANALGMGTGALAGGVSSTALGGAPSAGFTGWDAGVGPGSLGPGMADPGGWQGIANALSDAYGPDDNPGGPAPGDMPGGPPGGRSGVEGPTQVAALNPDQPLGRQGTMESLDILGRGRGISPEDIMNVSPDVWGRAGPEARGPALAQGQLGPAWNTQSLFSPSPLAGRDVEAEAREEAEIQGRFGPQEMRGPEVTEHVNPLAQYGINAVPGYVADREAARETVDPQHVNPLAQYGINAVPGYVADREAARDPQHVNPLEQIGLFGVPGYVADKGYTDMFGNPVEGPDRGSIFGPPSTAYEDYGTLTAGRSAQEHANPMTFGINAIANPADIGRGFENLGLNPVSEVTAPAPAVAPGQPGQPGYNPNNPFSNPQAPPGPFSQNPMAPPHSLQPAPEIQQSFPPAVGRAPSPQSLNPEGRDPFGRAPSPLSITVTPGQRGPAPGPAPSRGGGRGGPAPGGRSGPAGRGAPAPDPFNNRQGPAGLNAPYGITSLPGLQGLSPGQIAALEAMIAEQQQQAQAQAPIGAPSLFSMMG